MVVSCIRDRIQQKDYIETIQTMEICFLKCSVKKILLMNFSNIFAF